MTTQCHYVSAQIVRGALRCRRAPPVFLISLFPPCLSSHFIVLLYTNIIQQERLIESVVAYLLHLEDMKALF